MWAVSKPPGEIGGHDKQRRESVSLFASHETRHRAESHRCSTRLVSPPGLEFRGLLDSSDGSISINFIFPRRATMAGRATTSSREVRKFTMHARGGYLPSMTALET